MKIATRKSKCLKFCGFTIEGRCCPKHVSDRNMDVHDRFYVIIQCVCVLLAIMVQGTTVYGQVYTLADTATDYYNPAVYETASPGLTIYSMTAGGGLSDTLSWELTMVSVPGNWDTALSVCTWLCYPPNDFGPHNIEVNATQPQTVYVKFPGAPYYSPGCGYAMIHLKNLTSAAFEKDIVLKACTVVTDIQDMPETVNNFMLFPNPAFNECSRFSFNTNIAQDVEVLVADITGKAAICYMRHFEKGQVSEHIAGSDRLSPGSYILRLRTKDGVVSRPLQRR